MIIAYHRPKSLDEALALLARSDPQTVPLGGGTVLSRPGPGSFAVVDLQDLGLNRIEASSGRLEIGATVALQDLYAHAGIPSGLRQAIRRETTYNLRQTASVAGALVSADARSPFATGMLALDAGLVWASGEETSLETYYSQPEPRKTGLILRVVISSDGMCRYLSVAKTPADVPLVCGAVGQWPDGRQRLVIGGIGAHPFVLQDKTKAQGQEAWTSLDAVIEEELNNAHSQSRNTENLSSDYLKTTISILVQRLTSGQAFE